LAKKTGEWSKIRDLPQQDFERWGQNDFLSNMEELTGTPAEKRADQPPREARAYGTNQVLEEEQKSEESDDDNRSMYSMYSKYEPMRMGSFMGARPTAKSHRQTRPVPRSDDMQQVEYMFHDKYHNSGVAEAELKSIQEYSNALHNRIQKKKKKSATAIEKMVYDKDKLLFLITKRRLIANEIVSKREFCAATDDKSCVSKFEE
jgi:hypothetical protein